MDKIGVILFERDRSDPKKSGGSMIAETMAGASAGEIEDIARGHAKSGNFGRVWVASIDASLFVEITANPEIPKELLGASPPKPPVSPQSRCDSVDLPKIMSEVVAYYKKYLEIICLQDQNTPVNPASSKLSDFEVRPKPVLPPKKNGKKHDIDFSFKCQVAPPKKQRPSPPPMPPSKKTNGDRLNGGIDAKKAEENLRRAFELGASEYSGIDLGRVFSKAYAHSDVIKNVVDSKVNRLALEKRNTLKMLIGHGYNPVEAFEMIFDLKDKS